MPWFNLSFSDFIKKRVCKFLINRYLGQFFDEKLTADQICLDLYNGKGSVFDVKLCCESINSIFEAQGWDFEVTAGSIGSVTVGIPWNCLMSEDSIVEVDRLCLCLRPCPRIKDDGTTMLESMWSSMSSSMQLAQECLERNSDEEAAAAANSSNMEGLEKFAQTIDNILNRIKAKFINTEVRLEYLPKDSDVGVVLIMKLKSFEYQNEASSDTSEKDDGEKGDQKTILFATHATHHIALEDITFYTEEFRIGDPKKSTRSRKTSTKSAEDTTFNSTISTDPYLSAISSFSPDNEMFYNESASIKNEDEENDSDESDDEFDNVYRSEMVMIGRLANRQEIRINMKLAEQIEGPKVSLNMSIGALTLFFTPRQMHMLLLLCDIILNEAPSSGSDNEVLKEMSPPRQSRVEEEKRRFGGLMGHQTWSGEDYDCNSEFTSAREMHVINKLRPVETDSVFSSNSSSMTSSIGSSASANTSRRRRAIERDQNADISHFSIRIAGLYVVILHDDVLMATTKIRNDESPLNESSVEKLKRKCEHFFNCVAESSGTYSTSDLIKIGNMLKAACDNNHLRLMFAPIIVDGEERRTTKGNCTKLNVSISRADIHEILGDLCLPLLEFQRKDSTAIIPEQPEVSINIEKTFYVMRSSSGKQFTAPRLNLGVTLGIAKFDFDITIFDRLNALFSSPFSSFMSDGSSYDQDTSDLPPSSQKIVQSKSKIKIQSDCFSLVVRFPIVDLRPLHDPEKRPWWQRHVRPEFLVIKFSDFQLNYISPSTYDVMANEINVLYHETEKAQAINIARASLYEHTANKYYSSSTDYPRIVVQFPTDAQILEMNETFIREQSDGRAEDTDSDPASGESIKINPIKERESTPFSTKKVCRESDTPHGKTNEDESETLLIPGDRDEINSFCDNAMKFSKIQIKVDLPVISVQLKSKHLYEVIYNRIISDILMWESSVPKAKPPEVAMTLKKPPDSLMNAGMMDSIYAPFSMCKSKINFESGSSATNSESESENDAVYYSIHEKQRQKRLQSIYQKDYSNATSFQLHVGQGMVTMYAPVRDSSNHVIPGQLGEFVLKVSATTIFTVSSYHGNSNLGYFCIQSGNLEMFHCGQLPVPIQNPPLRDLFCLLPTWLKSSLYSTPKNLTLSESRGSTKRDMLSLAVQIRANPEQGIKRTKISAGVQMATLKHNASLPEHLWLTQLMDMFDVKEEIVPGYTPYTNLTEFHLHLWDCAIDYRPLHYPFRAVATIGTFMVSSNIATGSVGCTLRFVAEEATLCLAPQILSEELPEDNKISALPSIELISVAELGLFEISLRLNDKVTPLSPKYDLRAAIKDVHIRTCSDSGKALLEFISYLASEGDLVGEEDVDDAQSEASSMQQMNEPEDELLQMKTSTAPEVTQTQQQHVNSLMADAMEESIYIPSSRNNSGDSDELVDLGTDVFFFPDEQSKREIRFGSSGAIRKIDSCKRRYASEDSISIDSSSYREDEDIFVRRFEQREEDSGSVNTEMRELLDFETSVMIGLKEPIEDFDPLPQVEMDLGDISKYDTPPKRNQPTRKLSSDSDEDFCIVADEERPNYGEAPVVQTDDPIRIIDNHFSAPHGKPDLLKAPADFPMAVQRYTLCEMTLVWHMFGGHDFPTEDDKKKEKEERDEMNRRAFSSHYPMSEVYKMGVSYTKGSPMLMLGGGGGNSSSSNQPKLTWKTRGGYGRKHDVLMEIHLNKVRFSHETYPQTTEQASRQVLLITELEIRDRLAISNINKFLYHPTVGFRTRQGNNHMVVIKALHLRPEPALKTQECCLRISLLPIRLNIDQDSLLFLINFFNELSGGSDLSEPKPNANSNPQTALKPHQPPVMMVELPEAAQELQARKLVSENLTLLLNEEEKSTNKETTEAPSEPASDSASPIFFRHIIFSPDVPIRLDYQGKRVELSHGPLAGLLMGLGQLQCSEIRLKRISYRHGILGFDRLLNFLIQEWLQDIKKRQLPKILGGVGPMYSLVQLFQGIFDLFWLPIEQYQKDGRIVRGLQRGAQSFTARTALAALEITSRLIYLLQITAETAYDMVSPAGPSVRRRVNRKGKRKRIHPPQDIREGMSNAYHIVKDGIGDTANTIIQMAALEHDQKGYTGAVGAVMRQIPPTMVRPIVLAAQATTNVIGGLKNELIPNARIEAKEKWKDDDDN